jgi:DNA-directed RNA polymerase specialized sigma24 family protein
LKADSLINDEQNRQSPDEGVIIQEYPRLLRHAGRWCRKCGLNPKTDAKEILNDAVMELYQNPCPQGDEIAFLMIKIRRIACNRIKTITKQSDLKKQHLKLPNDHSQSVALPAPGAERKALLKELSAKVCTALYDMASEKDDEEVNLLLMAYEDGHEKKSDILDTTGLTSDHYEAAKKRLKIMLRSLPQDLLSNVYEELGVEYE